MTQPMPATGPAPAPSGATALATRFGPIPIRPERVITFPHGLFGYGGQTQFLLADVPERDVPFKVLQSADDPEVGFLVVPIEAEDGPIARADLERACHDLGFAMDRLIVLAIVTLRAEPGAARGTLNLKAPVLIDSGRLQGCQYVLADGRYALQVPLPIS